MYKKVFLDSSTGSQDQGPALVIDYSYCMWYPYIIHSKKFRPINIEKKIKNKKNTRGRGFSLSDVSFNVLVLCKQVV